MNGGKRMKVKINWDFSGTDKFVIGELTGEDELFYIVRQRDGKERRIPKNKVTDFREVEDGFGEDKK
jgi:hypothetical protein